MWVTDITALNINSDDHFYPWLTKPYGISNIMKQLCQNLTVHVISQHHGAAFADEKELLNIQENNSLIRQVYLQGDGVNWSYGRVVIPNQTYKQYQTEFDTLGNKLIGETLLYSDPDITRSPFEYARLNLGATVLYGRRSVFNMHGYLLLVMEVYLPALPLYPT